MLALKSAEIRSMVTEVDPPLRGYYDRLFAVLGPQNWWPGDTQLEVIVGAILTQSTAWRNVEQAIANLKAQNLMSVEALREVPLARLAMLVRPSGYFRQKARKLKAFISFLVQEFDGSLDRLFETPTAELRERLLQVFGIGPETADSILLYAGRHPVFVVDAYARRILTRHGWLAPGAAYQDVQSLFESRLGSDWRVFNEFHALIVNVGKNWCRRNSTRCAECPLGIFHEAGQ